MAALNRRNPNLDDFVGLNWSCWVDRVNILPSDAGSKLEHSKYGMDCSQTMTLEKEDMHIYGHCPSHDDFYLVVCSQCGQVVKPQAFEEHCERWHCLVMKMCGPSFTLAPQQSSCSSAADGGASSAASPAHPHKSAKTQRRTVSLSSVKFPEKNPDLLHHFSSMPCPPPLHSAPLPAGYCSSATLLERPSVQKTTARQSTESHCPLRGIRTYSRMYKNIQKKECELNKHSSILDRQGKRLCSRELKCNTDSVNHQQKAMSKTKIIDQLSVEQRSTSAGQDMKQLLVETNHKGKHLEAFKEKIANKYSFSSNCHLRRFRNPSESFPEEENNSTVEVEVQPPYPFNQSLLSSEDSEDEQDVATDLPATSWHPKPLGLCTFGCRTLGCSIFTFDRRLHHLWFALGAMLKCHVEAPCQRTLVEVGITAL